MNQPMREANLVKRGLRASLLGIVVNIALAVIKIVTGVVGNSYALVADGIESTADIISSIIVWTGLMLARKPADKSHPYGHGKAESLAALVVAAALLAAAIVIAVHSVEEIRRPHHAPKWFTLPVLVGVILIKWGMFRYAGKTAETLASTALKGDAWHHGSDALTSLAAGIGISIALIGGPGYEPADDWGALLACGVIAFNGLRLVWVAADELMDRAASPELVEAVRVLAASVPRVVSTEKCFLRKYGLGYIADIHVIVSGDLSVREGHVIAHQVKDALLASDLKVLGALIHIEPSREQSVRTAS